MKSISRTVTELTIKAEGAKYVDGKLASRQLDTYVTTETQVEAEKSLRRKLQEGENLLIKEVKTKEANYSLSLKKFIEASKAEQAEIEKAKKEKEEAEKTKAVK